MLCWCVGVLVGGVLERPASALHLRCLVRGFGMEHIKDMVVNCQTDRAHDIHRGMKENIHLGNFFIKDVEQK